MHVPCARCAGRDGSHMNLLMLILIALGIAVGVTIFRIAWRLTSDEFHQVNKREEPGELKESKDPPGSSENP